MSGIPLEPVYGPEDGDFPGVYPYTRGPYASMYRSKLWTMRMFAGFGTAIDTNGRFLGGLILPGHGMMLRALESGTAGLRVPTGQVCQFPTNTSDALTSGGTYAIAGAIERMLAHVRKHCGTEPRCIMTGGAGWKMAPSMSVPFELVDNLIFDGLLEMAVRRFSIQ